MQRQTILSLPLKVVYLHSAGWHRWVVRLDAAAWNRQELTVKPLNLRVTDPLKSLPDKVVLAISKASCCITHHASMYVYTRVHYETCALYTHARLYFTRLPACYKTKLHARTDMYLYVFDIHTYNNT